MCKVRLFIAVSGSAEPGQLKPTRWYQACNLHLQESQAYNSQVAGSVHKKRSTRKANRLDGIRPATCTYRKAKPTTAKLLAACIKKVH